MSDARLEIQESAKVGGFGDVKDEMFATDDEKRVIWRWFVPESGPESGVVLTFY